MKKFIREAGGPVQLSIKAYSFIRREGILAALRLIRDIARFERPQSFKQASPNPALTAAPSVDIIVCVHNALEDVSDCLKSLLSNLEKGQRILVIDDGSSDPTRVYLDQLSQTAPVMLLRNETAKGYTFAANQGLRMSKSDYVVLLNSDTVVPKGWLSDMIQICETNPSVGIVGPLSNTASWQSIPALFDQTNEWAANEKMRELSPDLIQDSLRETFGFPPVEVGFLNGFCLLIRSEVIRDVGLLDEEKFGQGYGEENDYCLRVKAAGWKLVVSTKTFVRHTQSRSYGHERRRLLSDQASKALSAKHGQQAIATGLEMTRDSLWLEVIREFTREIPELLIKFEKMREDFAGKSVLFVLPVTQPGGGAQVVIDEAKALQLAGVRVFLLNLSSNKHFFRQSFPGCPVPVIYIDSPEEIQDAAFGFDAVVATVNTTVPWIRPLSAVKSIRLAYYVQDFEPDFYPKESRAQQSALQSYRSVEGLRIITKTDWNKRKLEEIGAESVNLAGPSLVMDLPTGLQNDLKSTSIPVVKIAAMVRVSTERRQPKETLWILEELHAALGENISITIFGSSDAELDSIHKSWKTFCTNIGEVPQSNVSQLLATTHVFLDFSKYQAMGLTGLQALALGNLVFAPIEGAFFEIVASDRAIQLPTDDAKKSLEIILRTLDSSSPINSYRKCVIQYGLHPIYAAHRIAQAIFE